MSSIRPHAMLVLLAAVAAVDTEVTYLFHQWKVSTAPPRLSTRTPQTILQPQISARNKPTTIQARPPAPENVNDKEETMIIKEGDKVEANEYQAHEQDLNTESTTTAYVPETSILHDIQTTPAKPTNSTTGTTKLIDLATLEPKENGGYPFAKPGKHKHGLRHVKAHDGFHNLKREPQWAHWNDKFKSTAKP
ncbi:uncharacterized protein [Drosophila virilis]|uniref:Uncharacterized protein n=1 Tax=Drosophila virilis TaxID=7244 RepID=B4LVF9_DROVI|nr:uncharacterized protein LOC6628298 [Drosophila virilis]EDW63338.1 uncharacterized protein Dvir_GJ14663 [Drosophila virilis]